MRVEEKTVGRASTKTLQSVRQNQAGLQNTITEMKITLEDISIRLANAEEQIGNRKDRLGASTNHNNAKEKNILKRKLA